MSPTERSDGTSELLLDHAFTLDVALGDPIEIGPVPGGVRRIIPIVGGRFDGPLLSGEILPGGADWNLVRPDGVTHLWARYTIRTHDGDNVMVTNEGWGTQDDDTMQRIFSGTFEPDGEFYCRTQPKFEAGAAALAFLNRSVFVGDLRPPTRVDQVIVDIYRVR